MRPTISRSALATLTTTLLLGCGAGAPSGDIAAGKAHLDKGDYVAAAIEFKTVLQQNPESGESRYLLGIALRKASNLAASEIELRKAAAAGFDKTLVHPELIAVLSESAQFAKVLSEAKPEESRSSKVKAELQARVGDAFLATGKRDKARAAFEDSLATDPASPGGKLGFARLSAMARDFAKAHQLTDEALATAPDSLDALQFKADLFVAEGKGKEAITIYSKAIELRPAAVSLYLGFVPLLIADRDPKGAAEWLGKLKKAVPDTIVATYLEALIAYSNGDRGRARELVRIALKDAPDFPQALLLAGQTEHDLGSYVQAEEHLRKSITLMPEATQPRRLLASTYFRAGQLAKAQETITPLLKDSSTDGASWLLAGEFALSAGDTATAVARLEKAVSLQPKNTFYQARLGLARLTAGGTQSARAVQDLETLSAADPTQYDADIALLNHFLGTRNLEKAAASVEILKRKQPDNPLSHNLAGVVALARDDKAGARSAFARALELQPAFYPAAHNLALLDRQEKKPDAAAARYEQFLTHDPRNEEALLALVNLTQETKKTPGAVEAAIERVIAANPGSVRGHMAKIELLLRAGNTKGALVAAQQAQAALPDDSLIMSAVAKTQLLTGDNTQAVISYGKLAAMEPKSPIPLIGKADAYIANRDWANAMDALKAAGERDPNAVLSMSGLVKIGVLAGKLATARSDAVAIQKRFPSNAMGYLLEADVLLAQNQPQEAERVLRATQQKLDAPMVTFRLFGFLSDMKKNSEAEAVLNDWIAKHPKDNSAVHFAAQYHVGKKQYGEAVKWYRVALRTKPDDVATMNNLAWTLGELGDSTALSIGVKALEAAPSNPDVLDTVGGLHVKAGDAAKGSELLAKAVQIAPNRPNLRISYANALIAQGKRADADKQLDEATRLDPSELTKAAVASLRGTR